MLQTVEKLTKEKVPLSVPLIASYLSKHYRPADIARACNVSNEAVSRYIKRHYDELAPLVDSTDGILAMRSKHLANKAQGKMENILEVDKFNKKDLFALNAISGTHIDKMRLLSDKSTSNVSIASLNANLDDLTKQRKELEAKLKEC